MSTPPRMNKGHQPYSQNYLVHQQQHQIPHYKGSISQLSQQTSQQQQQDNFIDNGFQNSINLREFSQKHSNNNYSYNPQNRGQNYTQFHQSQNPLPTTPVLQKTPPYLQSPMKPKQPSISLLSQNRQNRSSSTSISQGYSFGQQNAVQVPLTLNQSKYDNQYDSNSKYSSPPPSTHKKTFSVSQKNSPIQWKRQQQFEEIPYEIQNIMQYQNTSERGSHSNLPTINVKIPPQDRTNSSAHTSQLPTPLNIHVGKLLAQQTQKNSGQFFSNYSSNIPQNTPPPAQIGDVNKIQSLQRQQQLLSQQNESQQNLIQLHQYSLSSQNSRQNQQPPQDSSIQNNSKLEQSNQSYQSNQQPIHLSFGQQSNTGTTNNHSKREESIDNNPKKHHSSIISDTSSLSLGKVSQRENINPETKLPLDYSKGSSRPSSNFENGSVQGSDFLKMEKESKINSIRDQKKENDEVKIQQLLLRISELEQLMPIINNLERENLILRQEKDDIIAKKEEGMQENEKDIQLERLLSVIQEEKEEKERIEAQLNELQIKCEKSQLENTLYQNECIELKKLIQVSDAQFFEHNNNNNKEEKDEVVENQRIAFYQTPQDQGEQNRKNLEQPVFDQYNSIHESLSYREILSAKQFRSTQDKSYLSKQRNPIEQQISYDPINEMGREIARLTETNRTLMIRMNELSFENQKLKIIFSKEESMNGYTNTRIPNILGHINNNNEKQQEEDSYFDQCQSISEDKECGVQMQVNSIQDRNTERFNDRISIIQAELNLLKKQNNELTILSRDSQRLEQENLYLKRIINDMNEFKNKHTATFGEIPQAGSNLNYEQNESQINDLKEILRENELTTQNLNSALETANHELNSKNWRIEELTNLIDQISQEKQKIQISHQEAIDARDIILQQITNKAEIDCKLSSEKIDHLLSQIKTLSEKNKELLEERTTFQREVSRFESLHFQMNSANSETLTRISSEKDHQIEKLLSEISQMRNQMLDQESDLLQTRRQKSILESQMESIRKQQKDTNELNEALQENIIKRQAAIQAAEAECEKLRSDLRQYSKININ